MLVSVFAHSVYHDGCVLFRKGGAILAIGSDVTYSFRYTYILIYLYTYILIYSIHATGICIYEGNRGIKSKGRQR